MKVLFFWEAAGLSLEKANPYAGLLGRAMSGLGVEFEAGFRSQLAPEFLDANRNIVTVLHFNWPSALYSDPDPMVAVGRAAEFLSAINYARSLGIKIVWTMHNLYPHDTTLFELDRLVRLALTSCADSVIVHCEYGREQLRRHFFREHAVFTIPHGNFIEPYPNTLTRREARARLGIEEDKFVYLFFGTVRANKGVDNLIEAFGRVPDPDAVLLLAARVYNDYGDTIVDRARHGDPRISVLRSTFYQNDEFQLFYNAADIAVFPFTDILTSGSAITAMSLGCPVIVPAIGCLPELMDERIGLTYDPAHPASLEHALARARQIDLASCRVAALDAMRKLHWEGIARRTLLAYGVKP